MSQRYEYNKDEGLWKKLTSLVLSYNLESVISCVTLLCKESILYSIIINYNHVNSIIINL